MPGDTSAIMQSSEFYSSERMYRKGEETRDLIIDTADRLFYERGYEHTSFRGIAREAGVPSGNFYHYFKAKEDILKAVIERRVEMIQAQLDDWQAEHDTPLLRLKRFVQIVRNADKGAIQYGCPMGTLTTELGKQREHQVEANIMFDVFTDWLERQFRELGFEEESRTYARRLLAYVQGVSVVAHAYHDVAFLHQEADALDDWLERLAQTAH